MKHLLTRLAVWFLVRYAIKRAKQGIKEGVFVAKYPARKVTLEAAVHDTLEGDIF